MALDLVLGVALVLGLMIMIHEWGHFVVARLFKVRVDVFSIGFGPRLFGWKRGATDYRISALPFGGYVRMAGQDPSEIDSSDKDWSKLKAKEHTAPETFTQAAQDLIDPAEKVRDTKPVTGASDELMSKPRWQRALISAAGPAVNLIFPLFILSGLFIAVGIPYSAYLDRKIEVVGLSAEAAKDPETLRVGDKVLEFNGVANPTWEQAEKVIKQVTVGGTLEADVDNGGEKRHVKTAVKDLAQAERFLGYPPLAPIMDQVFPGTPADHAGLKENDVIQSVDGQPITYWGQFVDHVRGSSGKPMTLEILRGGKTVQTIVTPAQGLSESSEKTYQVGVAVKDPTLYRRAGLVEGVQNAASLTVSRVAETLGVVQKLFSGRVSVKQLSGPAGISRMAGEAVHRGALAVISLMVLISVNLGILNLLPIPILDGGNILLLAIEGLLRRDLSMAFKERFVQVGFVFLLALFAYVFYNDVMRMLPSHS